MPARTEVLDVVVGGDRRRVAVIRVAVGDHVVHATKADKVFLRVGDENRELSYAQSRELTAEARTVIKDYLPTRQALGADGRFGPVGIVPEDGWMEGVVNAVVHRSYSTTGDHIRVTIFDDRIEFESPGRFPGVVGLSEPPALTRFARNPRIARVCADLRFGQELGEGIRRMFARLPGNWRTARAASE